MKLFDKTIKIREYTVSSPKINNKFRMALVTDIHSEIYGRNMKDLIDAVISGKPDMMLLCGDICDKRFPKENTEIFLNAVKGRYPSYMVMGNHDYDFTGTGYVESLAEKNGVIILNERSIVTEINGNTLNVCGIGDIRGVDFDHKKWNASLDSLNGVHENGNYTLFMCHRPDKMKKFAGRGFDLIVCGHAHGGQWIWPGVINGLYAPGQGVFPKYAGGKYDLDECTAIVCRGLAQHTTKIPRIMNPSELVFIDAEPG